MRCHPGLLLCLLAAGPGCSSQKTNPERTPQRAAETPSQPATETPSPPAEAAEVSGPTLRPGQIAKSGRDSVAPTELRPLVTSLAAGDPVRLAIRWQHVWDGGRWHSRGLAGDTLKSFRVAVEGPDGERRELSVAEIVEPELKWPVDRTMIFELGRDAITTASGYRGTWANGARMKFDRAGVYRISVAGSLGFKDESVAFASGTISIEIGAPGLTPLAAVEAAARAELERRVPALAGASDELVTAFGRTESGFVPNVVVETGTGERVVRFAASGPRWSYNLYSVTLDSRGEVENFAEKEIHTCIAQGTAIAGEQGAVAIEDIRIGDRIWGYDLNRRQRVLTTVRHVRRKQAAETVVLAETLRVTGNHPVYVDGAWIPAGRTEPGQSLLPMDGRSARLAGDASIRWVDGPVSVYDITADEPHNYFAGGFLVHNKDRGYNDNLDDPWLFMWNPPG